MIDITILDAIKRAIEIVPGVASFADYNAKTNASLKTDDISQAIELTSADTIERIKVHLILINGVNIRDVVNEVQMNVKYELEKNSQFVRNYIVDVTVDDVISI